MKQTLNFTAERCGECAVVDSHSQFEALQDGVIFAEPFGTNRENARQVDLRGEDGVDETLFSKFDDLARIRLN
ncbi:hypothetical protein CUT44_16665 [Streptomyces carminius]|uniref:Uncharacterized protein n=1 Tax=Streptomyces carminius TaxID=2665496 RepID=A0A2M8LXI1_9ACTN|nr:hypothetical protein CUT44_16665 [Streptomyces carminius]